MRGVSEKRIGGADINRNTGGDVNKNGGYDVVSVELVATVAMVAGLPYVLLYFMENRHGMT